MLDSVKKGGKDGPRSPLGFVKPIQNGLRSIKNFIQIRSTKGGNLLGGQREWS